MLPVDFDRTFSRLLDVLASRFACEAMAVHLSPEMPEDWKSDRRNMETWDAFEDAIDKAAREHFAKDECTAELRDIVVRAIGLARTEGALRCKLAKEVR